MKNFFIAVLLIAALGGGAYYFFFSKKKASSANKIQKELIAGKWRIDSLSGKEDSSMNAFAQWLFALDSNAKKTIYDFQNDGQVFISYPDDSTGKKDTSAFAWGKATDFSWKENPSDSTAESLTVVKLDSTDFVLQSKDSVLIYFKKVK